MHQSVFYSANVVLFGLDEDLASELVKSLAVFCRDIDSSPYATAADCIQSVARCGAGLVFCGPSPALVRDLRAALPDVPLIVVSRLPEVTDWLDAIEAGANDYCAAPFETAALAWILESNLRHACAAA